MIMEIKKQIIYVLVAFTVVLIILNAVLGVTENSDTNEKTSGNFQSRLKIEKTFEKILSTYGVQSSWIKKQKIKNNQIDSIKYKYKIEIPTSVPIPMIIKEISLSLKNKNVNITSKEEKINGSTELKIKSENYIKLVANLEYNPSLNRPYSSIAFILNDIEDLNENELNNLLTNSFKFGALLPLRSASTVIAERILASKKNYFINLDDDSDKLSFELDEDLNVNQLKRNIKSIVSSFNTPRFYFISKKETGFSNSFISFLSEEFNKRNRKILRLNSFIKLQGENKQDLNSLLDFHLNKLKTGTSKLFFINIDDWWNIQTTLNYYLKKGNKIVLPTKLLRIRNSFNK